MRAVIYCRISQDATGEAAGVARQEEDCRALVDLRGWTLVDTYVDNDISATSGRARPAYRRLLADIAAGRVDAVICWHPDRLYRKLADLEELLNAIEKRDVTIQAVRAGELDLSTPTGRMVARILGSVATAEGEMKSDRWKRSVRQRREAGAMPHSGPRMMGWTREGDLVPDEADAIRWIADQLASGHSLRSVAVEAGERGIRSTLGNPLTTQAIKRLMLNPRLAGYSVLKGEIIGTGNWTPILDVETWETVVAILNTAARRPGGVPRVSTLPGLIWCGGCGAPMVTGSRMMKRGGTQRTYRCNREVGRAGCQKVSIVAEAVEEYVEGYARQRLDHPATREHLAELRKLPRLEVAELSGLTDRLVELEQQLDQPGVPVDAIVRAMDRTRARIEELTRLVGFEPSVTLPDIGKEWPADVPTRRALVALVVERVTIAPSGSNGRLDLGRVQVEPRTFD